ncbi:Heat shock protein DnaJ with tetratricopeptide repeat [Quillaja saponaria]|nr:Heat shock protein DnaJ with tetratricopeptide repeat [Quillaja saponaria]
MSPAAADLQSPFGSPRSKPSASIQSSDSMPHAASHSSLNYTVFESNKFSESGQSLNSSAFGNVSGCDFAKAFTSPALPRSGSAASARSRPRLVKVRKQFGSQHARSRAAPSEVGTGFNPFRFGGETSDQVSSGICPSSGTRESSGVVENDAGDTNRFRTSNCHTGNAGFEFGSRRSEPSMNLNYGQGGAGTNDGTLGGSIAVGQVTSENERVSSKIENLGFVFTAEQSDMESNSCQERLQFEENAATRVYGEVKTMKSESELMHEKLNKMGFMCSANQNHLMSNSNWKIEPGKFMENSSFSDGKERYKTEVESSEKDNTGFTFAANFHMDEKGSNDGMLKPDRDVDTLNTKTETNTQRYTNNNDNLGFIFGSDWFNLASELNLEMREVGEIFGEVVCDTKVCDNRDKVEVESETKSGKVKAANVKFNASRSESLNKGYDKDAFVFESSGKKCCDLNERVEAKGSDEMLKSENVKKYDSSMNMKTQTSSLSSEINDKSKSVLRNSSNTFSNHNTIPPFKLPEKMEKLNINYSEDDGADFATYYNKNSCLDTGSAFMFRSNEKVCSPSGTNSDDQKSRPAATFENIGGHHSETCERNQVQDGSGCANDSSEVSCPKLFTNQAGAKDSHMGKIPHCEVAEDSQLSGADAPFAVSTAGLAPGLNNGDFEVTSMDGVRDKHRITSTSISEGLRESFMDFKPPTWDPSCFKENLFPRLSKSSKEKGPKKMRRKLKPPILSKRQPMQDSVPKESCSLDNQNSPGGYSPMDFSPYQERAADDPYPKETSASSNESSMPDHEYVPSVLHPTIPTEYKDDDLVDAVEEVDINKAGHKSTSPNQKRFQFPIECSFTSDSCLLGAQKPFSSSKTEQVCSSSGAGTASAEAGAGFTSNNERLESDCRFQFQFSDGLGDMKENLFLFSTSSSGQGTSSPMKRRYRRSSRKVGGCDSFVIPPPPNVEFGSQSLQFPPLSSMPLHVNATDKSGVDEQFKFNQGVITTAAAIQETCDKWRLRGNQAYKNGNLSKAEEFYTNGINAAPSSTEGSGCWLKPLLLCYSNRAATRMGLGRIRDALGDCEIATVLDPAFLKVQMRAANCHLVLGEVENAQKYFNKCLASDSGVCLDRRVIVEAADGLQKAQKVAKCTNHSDELLEQRTSDAALSALELIKKALSISLYSEKLLQMKAEALCLLQKYDEAIQICEQSRCFAEKNFASAKPGENGNGSGCDSLLYMRLWRWSLISRCYFHLGRLEASLDVVEKLEQDVSVTEKSAINNLEMTFSLAATIRELLSRKKSGNDAFKLGKYAEAVEHYTIALSSNIKSRPFAAICYCNRAAAHQALGQIVDAISDCSLAIALDGSYAKAISRRATLHEIVRDYGQAACDLRRLIPILENQSGENAKLGTPGSSNCSVKESRQAHRHLLLMEEKTKNEIALDLYLILGIKPSATAPDIKKAYHKAALRHHPDKAGHLLARSEVGNEGRLWKEIAQEVHKDADRLFKMIGEAYAVLSVPDKRSQYDLEEELRRAPKQSYGSSSYRRSDGHSGPFDRSTNRRHGKYTSKTYGNYPQW